MGQYYQRAGDWSNYMRDSAASASPESVNSVAVAINHGSKSQQALGWALDNLVSEGQIISLIHIRQPIRSVPTPMGNYIPITQVCKEAAAAYRKQVYIEIEEWLMPYRELCRKKKVQADIAVMEDFSVPNAIVKYISWSGVSKLVMGSPSRNAFARRIKSPDVPATVAKNAPKYCILYVILKAKLLSVTPAVSSNSTRSFQVGVRKISSFDLDSNCSSASNKSPQRDADDRESSMKLQSKYQAVSFGNPVVGQNILDPENAALHADKLIWSPSSKIGICENSTYEKRHSPTAPIETQLLKSISEVRRNFSTTNEESKSVSMLDVEARVYSSDHKPKLQASAETLQLPSIPNVSIPDDETSVLQRHDVLSNKNEIMSKDQSRSDFQHDKQNSFGTKMEENTISMKNKSIEDPSETEYTEISSSPKASEGEGRHSLVIPNSEGRGYSEENMELQTSPTGHCRGYSNESLFEISLEDLEAHDQINIVSKSLDHAILDIEENAFKFSQDLENRSASGKTSSSSSSSGDIMTELEKLKLELSRIRQQYGGAFKEAVAAKKKVQELDLQRVEDSKKLESAKARVELAIAIAAEEMARRDAAVREAEAAKQIADIESKLRKNAEIIARKKSQDMKKAKKVLVSNDQRYRKYTVEEIDKATNFSSESIKIGEGAYGSVYKCVLDHTTVAIKVLSPDASHGWIQFQQEVEVLCRIRHPHVVLLLGACPESGCLVYEYMANGSLEDRLFRKGATPPLPWFLRFKIAWEVAAGLLFLHSSRPEPLVHRDLKPANVLLDKNFVSKIGDVGFARLIPASVSCSITQYRKTSIAGTFYYIDPEYQRTGTLGTKSDLYAFGIMLLQLLTAKSPEGLSYTVERAVEKGTFSAILDRTVKGWPVEEALKLAKLALKCSELRRKDRPDLATVVLPELQRLKDFAEAHFESRGMGNAPLFSLKRPLNVALPKAFLWLR